MSSAKRDVQNTFHSCQFQAHDQAKAAVKGGHFPNEQLMWLIFIGPYFTILELGPFTSNHLLTRSHKPNASGDFLESLVIESEKSTDPLERHGDVYLSGTPEGAEKLEFFITSTSKFLA